ncbi:unnamed protein product [Pleuronectes platessa]|uniref:Uncharacterized protein n=1 Tax=Pleuronectes platessa TaxID=8262 RepID=A0A9N7Z0X0_PLEPL|nr:unnamed protein product [Pleuronectes platessa]
MKCRPQTEPVAGAASSEEQPQSNFLPLVHRLSDTEEEMQPISSQTDLTVTPYVKTSVTEEEVEKLYEVNVDVASAQNTEEEMQQISEQSDSTIALLQEEKKSDIFQGDGGKEPDQDQKDEENTEEEMQPISSQTDLNLTPHVKTSVTEEEVEKLSEDIVDVASTQNTEEEMQPISNRTDPNIDVLQWELKSDIFKGYGWKEPIVFKIKPKRKMKPQNIVFQIKICY